MYSVFSVEIHVSYCWVNESKLEERNRTQNTKNMLFITEASAPASALPASAFGWGRDSVETKPFRKNLGATEIYHRMNIFWFLFIFFCDFPFLSVLEIISSPDFNYLNKFILYFYIRCTLRQEWLIFRTLSTLYDALWIQAAWVSVSTSYLHKYSSISGGSATGLTHF